MIVSCTIVILTPEGNFCASASRRSMFSPSSSTSPFAISYIAGRIQIRENVQRFLWGRIVVPMGDCAKSRVV